MQILTVQKPTQILQQKAETLILSQNQYSSQICESQQVSLSFRVVGKSTLSVSKWKAQESFTMEVQTEQLEVRHLVVLVDFFQQVVLVEMHQQQTESGTQEQ